MAVLGRKSATKDQVMVVGAGLGVPRLAATIYGPVPVNSWVTAFGGLVGTRGQLSQDLTIGAYEVDEAGAPRRWLGEAAFTVNTNLVSGAGEAVELRQTVANTGLANEGIPLPVGSYVAIYLHSTDEVAVSYQQDGTSTAFTIDNVTEPPDPFGEHEAISGRSLDLFIEYVANNDAPIVNATAMRDGPSNGGHVLSRFFTPSGHVAVWGGEPAVSHSRFDLADELHGDELSAVHLQVATAPDAGSVVWERTLTKGEFYPLLQASSEPAYEMLSSYIGPKLPPGVYFVRTRFADHFGAFSDWTPWLDQGGAFSRGVWVDRQTNYLTVTPGLEPIDRIPTTNPAAFTTIYGVESTVDATSAHLLVSEVEEDVVSRVVLSEVVDVFAQPGEVISVPWDVGWDDLEPGREYAHRLRAIARRLWEPLDDPALEVRLWLKGDGFKDLADGDPVALWPDGSGNGYDVAQVTAGNRPTYQTGELKGMPVVRFDGSDWLTIASTLGIVAQPFSQFAVWKPSGPGQALMFWSNGTGLLTTDFDDEVGIFSGSALFNFDSHPFGQWHIVAGVHNGNGPNSLLGVDGELFPVTGGAGSNPPGGNLTIGAGINGGDRWLNGDLAEMIITRSAPTTEQRRRIEGYLAWKWGLEGLLPGGHPYRSQPPGAELNRWYVSNAPEWRRFRTNAAPSVPTSLTPDSAEGVGEFPLLVAIASDADDTPATGFGVRFRLTRPDVSTVIVNARLRPGTNDTWECQTGEEEITALGAYDWEAQAFDSAVTTAWSPEASFIYGELPVVTIAEPDSGEIVSGAILAVQWTSDSPQTAYQVTVTDPAAGKEVYDSGLVVSASLSHNVPTADFQHDRDYTVGVASTDNLGLVGRDEVTFHMLFSLPATPTGFTAEPLELSGDIEPTVVGLSWNPSADPDFVAYRATRQTSQEGDDGTAEVTLAMITDVEKTTFFDRFPASDVPYTYRVYVVAARGASDVASLPASDTATISLSTVVLTGVGFGTELRVPLRYLESSDVDHTTDETLLFPWGDQKPIAYEGGVNYRVINAQFALVSDGVEDAAADLATLRRLNGSLPGSDERPIVCYRDDRGRKLFGTMRLREQDREIAWYGIGLVVTETNYREGP